MTGEEQVIGLSVNLSERSECLCTVLLTLSYHINLSVGVAHVADNGAIFHSVQLVSSYHILVP